MEAAAAVAAVVLVTAAVVAAAAVVHMENLCLWLLLVGLLELQLQGELTLGLIVKRCTW
jgi:hypothetical protein